MTTSSLTPGAGDMDRPGDLPGTSTDAMRIHRPDGIADAEWASIAAELDAFVQVRTAQREA